MLLPPPPKWHWRGAWPIIGLGRGQMLGKPCQVDVDECANLPALLVRHIIDLG